MSFGDGFAGLVGEDLGEIIAVGDDQVVPGQEVFGALAGRHSFVGAEGGVGGIDGERNVNGGVVGTGGEGTGCAWI